MTIERLDNYNLGDQVWIMVQTTDANGRPATPDHCPTARIIGPTGTITTVPVPVLDRFAATGLFLLTFPATTPYVQLGGIYLVEFSWSVGTFTGHDVQTFSIVPGGGTLGTITSMTYYKRPFADFIVAVEDQGTLRAGRNPRI